MYNPTPLKERTNSSEMLKLNLSQKALTLISAPLLLWIALVIWLNNLQDNAELDASQALKAKTINESVNEIAKTVYETVSAFAENNNSPTGFPVGPKEFDALHRVRIKYRTLNSIVENPVQREVIQSSERAIDDGLSTLQKMKMLYESTGKDEAKPEKKQLNHQLKRIVRSIISDELLDLAREKKLLVERSPENQAKIRQQEKLVMACGVLANLFLSIGLVLFLVKGVTARLNILADNAIRLASNEPLTDKLGGNDEIALLDDTFRRMAEALMISQKRETALVRNARNMICSIDKHGKFMEVNPASEALLGRTPNELIGSYYIDLVTKDSVLPVLGYFETALSQESVFEVPLKHSTGRVVYTEWSCRWSQEERSFFCVIDNISERKELERTKQEIISMVSHDLRSPIATVSGFLDLLGAGAIGSLDKNGEKLRSFASSAVARMLTLINDLLGLERIKAGMLNLECDEFPLDPVIAEAVASVTGWASEKKIMFNYDQTGFTAYGDKDRIAQVLANLCGNAAKFSPKNSTVRVEAIYGVTGIRISVKDKGRGVPPELRESIFERFQQASSEDSKMKSGSGLGLAICKALVELHGGKIWVESEENRGSSFIFELPHRPKSS